jgi:hypothetical protein
MGDKWCPAGEIECECFNVVNADEGSYCTAGQIYIDLYQLESCPWPSRQQPIDSKAETVIKADKFGKCPVGNFNCENYDLAKHTLAFEAGRAEGVRVCVEAVKNVLNHYDDDDQDVALLSNLKKFIIAALEGEKGEK